MNKIILTILCLAQVWSISAQDQDVSSLVAAMLGPTPIESDLQELCDEIGGRVTGSIANVKAVEWGVQKFKSAGVKTWKDPFTMPTLWLGEGSKLTCSGLDFEPLVVAKYHTPPGVYKADLLLVNMGLDADYAALGIEDLTGKFILVETDLCLDIDGLFAEYGHAAKVEAAARKRNAAGIIFMSSRPNKLLYRFVTTKMTDNVLPQLVMAREDAQRCQRLLTLGNEIAITIDVKASVGPSFESHNVIAEIIGSEYPDEVVIIGAHLDSWALGTGANDNGCNVAMMIDIARQMKRLDIRPKRTVRFALWNGEEQGYYGSLDYTREHEDQMKNHKMALSVDIGSGAIIGFFTNGREELVSITDKTMGPVSAFGPFTQLNVPVVGTDNFDFMLQGVPNLVALHKPQVYGPNYHASSDTYDKVDINQLKINSAIIAALTLGYANLDQEMASQLGQQTRAEVQEIFDTNNLEFSMRMFNVWSPWVQGVRGLKK